jgi:hypothetical protein
MAISVDLLDEPRLVFGNNHLCSDPKVGLSSYGPAGLDVESGKTRVIRAGAIGTPQALAHLREFLLKLSFAIAIKKTAKPQPWRVDFPGLDARGPLGFEVYLDGSSVETISDTEEQEVLKPVDRRGRIEGAVNLYAQKFVDLVTGSSSSPRYRAPPSLQTSREDVSRPYPEV